MPRFDPKATTTGASSSSATLALQLTVEAPSGEWWLFDLNHALVAWKEPNAALYHAREGVWVLHESPTNRLELISKEVDRRQYKLAGRALQIEARAAAEWLIKNHYELPVELSGFGNELTNAHMTPMQLTARFEHKEAAVHSEDFTMVNWFGTKYQFALGVQSSTVQVLWNEWEKSRLGLHQETIRDAVDAERDNFRVDKVFQKHPAFGTMIQNMGDGRYQLVPTPPSTVSQSHPAKNRGKRKDSAKNPSKSRQKPR